MRVKAALPRTGPSDPPATGFAHYLDSLAGSWEALATPHPGARVIRGAGYVAARFPRHPVFNNAVLLDAAALAEVLDIFAGTASYAVWSAAPSAGSSGGTDLVRALEDAGMRRDITTTAMVLDLGALAAPGAVASPATDSAVSPAAGGAAGPAVRHVSPQVVASLNGVGAELLEGVPGLLAYANVDGSSGLVLIPVGTDVNVSFVATRPDLRRLGLASLVLRFALTESLGRGFRTASLQATPMAASLYAATGFECVGSWQEWVPDAG